MDLSKFKPTAEDLAAIEDALAKIRDRVIEQEADTEIVITSTELRQAIKARRLRDRFIAAGLFEEPAWDMLLHLFASQLEHRRVSVTALTSASYVAPTTALRWIGKMLELGLVQRQPDMYDRRRSFIELTEAGSLAMRRYIAALRRERIFVAL